MALPGRPTAAVLWQMSAAVGREHLQPGDLAFLYTRTRAPFHVALYVGAGLVVVAPHTGADVQIEPLSAVPWDGYGRLLRGGLGDGLAHSVALATRRFAHPGPMWLDASQVANTRVESAGAAFDRRLFLSRSPIATPAQDTPKLVPLASVQPADTAGDTGVAGLVPLAAMSLLGGALADRTERRRLLQVSQLVQLSTSSLLALGAAAGNPPVASLYVLAGIAAAASGVDRPTRTAIIPSLVGPDEIQPAVAFNYGLAQLTMVIGPALGGIVIAVAG